MIKASKNFIAKLRKQKRENKSLFCLDNIKIIKDAISNKSIKIECVLTSLPELPFEIDAPVYQTDQNTINSLTNTKTPQKVLCITYLTQDVVVVPKTNFLVLDGLQDPGNVGTLIRSAFASGFDYVFLVDSVRKENDKLIRSSVGAVFNSKVFSISRENFVKFAIDNKLKLICADMNGENIFDFETDQLVGLVVGNEGQGVSEQLQRLCFKTIKIPMRSGIESLNAGVSGSIIMYQINKKFFK